MGTFSPEDQTMIPTVFVAGYGSMGRRHADTAYRLGAHVLAYDPAFDGRSPILPSRLVSSFDEGLEESTHVVIASPATAHAEQAMRALQAGKSVYIEKPITMTMAEGRAIQVAAAHANVPVAVGYQWEGYEPWVWWSQIARHGWQQIELRYVGDRVTWPGKTYTDLLLEGSHELLMAWSLIKGRTFSLAIDELNESRARLWWHGSTTHLLVELDWDQRGQASRHEWIITQYEDGPRHSTGFVQTDIRDRDQLDAAYHRSLAAWLGGKPLCGIREGLGVLELIEHIRAAA